MKTTLHKPKTNDKMVYLNWKKETLHGRHFSFSPGDMVRVKEGVMINRVGGVLALKNTLPPCYAVAFKNTIRLYRPNKLKLLCGITEIDSIARQIARITLSNRGPK